MNPEKEYFLQKKLVSSLQQLNPATQPRWGKMTVQHMVEHLAADALATASGHLHFEKMITPPENLPRMKDFLLSDKPFKENTVNPLIGKEPPPLRFRTIQAACGYLQEELIYFFEVFRKTPGLVTRNPFFGDLTYNENIQLLYKHALHHLRQFGMEPVIKNVTG